MGRRLSQNFLYDPSILRRIIQIAGLSQGDTVVEIGSGPGRLTKMLAERAGHVIAIELDRRFCEALKEDTQDYENIEVVCGDALRYPYETAGQFSVVANIPYHITTPLIFKLFEYRGSIKSMTLTVQKEVAERIVAGPGTKDYGVLSITVQYYGKPELKFYIPRGAFRPVPRVDSACIHIDVYKKPVIDVKDEKLFFRLIRTAFSHRRKTMLNALKTISPGMKAVLNATGIEPSRRPETVSIEEFAKLSEYLRTRLD
jgi:16S rRNA (adenine1518-N6/adenine1519-N6)-dimethyltransferase